MNDVESKGIRIEGSLMGFVRSHTETPDSVETMRDISTVGEEIGKRVIPIATDAGGYEEVEVVEPKSPTWRNFPA